VKSRWIEHLVVLGAYAVAALLMTYPLVLQLGDSIAGVEGDVWSYVWAMGWAKMSLFNLATNPFHSNYIFYPLGGATQLLWGTALPSFFSIPLQLAFGLVPAFNLTYLAATVLTGYGMYQLARFMFTHGRQMIAEGNQPLISISYPPFSIFIASLLAGLAFAFCALRLGYGLAFTNLYHTEFIPFYVLFLLKTTREKNLLNPILAGIFFGLNIYIDFQIAAFLALLTALWLIFVAFTWLRHRARNIPLSRTLIRRESTRWMVLAVVALAIALPMFVIVEQDFAVEGGDYIRVYPLKYSAARSYDLLAYVLPNARSSLYQALPAPHIAGVNAAVNVEGESQLSPDRQSFIGWTVLALALYGAWRSFKRGSSAAFWIISTIFFALLSFGPTLHIAGQASGLPLPYTALFNVPLLNHIRIPMRYGIMVFFGLALLVGFGANELFTGNTPRAFTDKPARSSSSTFALGGIFAVLLLAESATLPYPTLNFSVPPIYNTIAAQPGDFTVLEIPTFNWRAAAATEVFQTIHQKRILRAYTNRIAPDVADYFSLRQTPNIVRSLRILEGAEEGTLTPDELNEDRLARDDVLRFYHLRYAVLHRDWLDANRAAQIDEYLRDVLGARTFFNQDNTTAYEFPAPLPPPEGLGIETGTNYALIYLGRGWQIEPLAQLEDEQGRYVTGTSSEVYFDLGDNSLRQLEFIAFSERDGDVLECEINGQPVGAVGLKKGWTDYRLQLPPSTTINAHPNVLRLLHPPPNQNHIALVFINIR
jgi:hypothetical protein